MVMQKCCVPGCKDTVSSRHRFPNPVSGKARFEAWIKIIQNPELENISVDKIYANRRVCRQHFSNDCFSANTLGNLNYNAVPTLQITGVEASTSWNFNTSQDYQPSKTPSASKDVMITSEPSTPSVALQEDSQDVLRFQTSGTKRLLRQIGVSREVHLTPRKKHMYRTLSLMTKKMHNMSKTHLSCRRRLAFATTFSKSKAISHLQKHLTPTVFKFFHTQLRLAGMKPKGRRFSFDDKVFALSLFKQSGKAYRLLSKIFALPCRRTLSTLLRKVNISAGINSVVIDYLKKTVNKLKPLDRYCTLIFDEMKLSAHIDYYAPKDEILGFEDFGKNNRTRRFADHALVFMARGIKKKWKQPLSFTFCQNQTKGDILSILIKEHVNQLQAVGLIVTATICDQGSSNIAAIRMLKEQSRAEYLKKGEEYRSIGFYINDQEIIPLYDPPHLIKLIRNHMLEKDLLYEDRGVKKIAKWSHMVQLYEADVLEGEMRALPKITAQHVQKNKIKKMKVCLCTQVFSHKVATTMNMLAKRSNQDDVDRPGYIEKAATETASCFLFLDKLFDSVNGNSLSLKADKPLRCSLREGSPHAKFWDHAIIVLSSMKYISKDGRTSRPPTLDNWIKTIQGLKEIWKKLQQKGFSYLLLRAFNQDVVENFFGCVRSHGIRNINPTSSAFIGTFKTLLLNNLLTASSLGRNCEADDSESLFQNTEDFFKIACGSEEDVYTAETINNITEQPHATIRDNELQTYTSNYVVGYIVSKLKKLVFQDCTLCCQQLLMANEDTNHALITAREYTNEKKLCYVSRNTIEIFDTVKNIISQELPKICFKAGVRKQLLNGLPMHTFQWHDCEVHPDLKNQFCDFTIKVLLYNWCKVINRRLKGLDLRSIPKTDLINIWAMDYYKKHK